MNKVNRKGEHGITAALQKRRADHGMRTLETTPEIGGVYEADGRMWLNFSSNDYLDWARHPALQQAACDASVRYGTGATASRLICGTLPLHTELEKQVARHQGTPAALVFGSGFLANIGVIPALVGRGDRVFADRLIHASLIDAIRLSGAQLHRFTHNQPAALESLLQRASTGRRLICTESVFSMDGDLAPLSEIVELAARYDAMTLIDEAHAGGIFGPHGAGRVAELNLTDRVNILVGTFSKALGGYGGYVACSEMMRDWLTNHARSFIYTTALPPPVMAAAQAALTLLETGDRNEGVRLRANADQFRTDLQQGGLDTLDSASPIIPLHVGDNATTVRLAKRLRQDGIRVGAIRPPTVPEGRARLRLSVTLAHTPPQLEWAAQRIIRAFQEVKG